jgi:hypothetical protein
VPAASGRIGQRETDVDASEDVRALLGAEDRRYQAIQDADTAAPGVGLPDVEHPAGDRVPRQVAHRAVQVERRTRQAVGHVAGVVELRGAVDVEGAEHGGRRRLRVEAVVHLDDEHRQPEHIGGEDELLPLLVADLAGGGQPLHRGHPLGLGQPHLPREVVQVPHERGHQLGQARVLRRRPALHREIGDVVLGDQLHGRPPLDEGGRRAPAAADRIRGSGPGARWPRPSPGVARRQRPRRAAGSRAPR